MQMELAQDVSCPEITAQLAGRKMRLRFDHMAMYLAELYNMDMTGRRVNYLALLTMADAMCYTGMAAVIYGAAAAALGGAKALAPEDFDRMVTMEDCLQVRSAVVDAAMEALPEVAGVPVKKKSLKAGISIPGES